jgi:hypothetical protein
MLRQILRFHVPLGHDDVQPDFDRHRDVLDDLGVVFGDFGGSRQDCGD